MDKPSCGKAVFLDRDGVLSIPEFRNGRSYAPHSFDAFRLYNDAVSAVSLLKQLGYLVFVVTNQPDVGKGHTEQREVERMHSFLKQELEIDDIEVCFKTREQPSNKLKPKPDMLIDLKNKWGVDMSQSIMIGDRASDIDAAEAAMCRYSIFIDHEYTSERKPTQQNTTVHSLLEAVQWISAIPYTSGDNIRQQKLEHIT